MYFMYSPILKMDRLILLVGKYIRLKMYCKLKLKDEICTGMKKLLSLVYPFRADLCI